MIDKTDTSAEAVVKKAAMIERHQKRKAARHRINANYAAPDDRYSDIPEILRTLAAERDDARAALERVKAEALRGGVDIDRMAEIIWDKIGSDYTLTEATTGQEKATHAEAVKWVYDIAAAIRAETEGK